MGGVMKVFPGDLVSTTAGAILRRGMMVHGVVTAPDGCDVVFDDMLVHEAPPHGTTVVSGYGISLADPARLSVDPNDELTRDACARWLGRHLLDASWGEIEGVTPHMSHRGYMELHIWTTKLHGRTLAIDCGRRFSNVLPPSFGAFEEWTWKHGWPQYSLQTRHDGTDLVGAMVAACLAAGGRL